MNELDYKTHCYLTFVRILSVKFPPKRYLKVKIPDFTLSKNQILLKEAKKHWQNSFFYVFLFLYRFFFLTLHPIFAVRSQSNTVGCVLQLPRLQMSTPGQVRRYRPNKAGSGWEQRESLHFVEKAFTMTLIAGFRTSNTPNYQK